jgi:hypothetical protein
MVTPQYAFKQLTTLRRAKPFVPFIVVTKDGQRYPVAKWHHVGTNGDLLFITNDEDRIAHLTLDDVQKIETSDVAVRG